MSIDIDPLTRTLNYRNEATPDYVLKYANRALGMGNLAIVFGDVVGLGIHNARRGTVFADRLLTKVGEGFDLDVAAHEDVYDYIVDSAITKTRTQPEGSDVQLPDLWVRKGGDEIIGLLPLRFTLDSEEIVHRTLGRVEASIASKLEQDRDKRFSQIKDFPIRFGFNVAGLGHEFTSPGDLISLSDRAANLAKQIGYCRKATSTPNHAYRVHHKGVDQGDYEGVHVVRDSGELATSIVHTSASVRADALSGRVRSFTFDGGEILGALAGVIRIEPSSGRDEVYVGTYYRTPVSGEIAEKPVWLPFDRYNASYLKRETGLVVPKKAMLRGVIEELSS